MSDYCFSIYKSFNEEQTDQSLYPQAKEMLYISSTSEEKSRPKCSVAA